MKMSKGASINDVSSKGEGGGHKIGKMGRRRLWMALNMEDKCQIWER